MLRTPLIVPALALLLIPATVASQVIVPMTGLEAYLRTDPIDNAQPARIVSLATHGLAPGTAIRITPQGDFDNGPGGDQFKSMLAVFSSSATLLGATLPDRVPDAIDAGKRAITGPTCPSLLPTDIPLDFAVPDTGVVVVIPPGATHLFVQPGECFYSDNTDPDADYAVRIEVTTLDAWVPGSAAPALHAPSPNPAAGSALLRFALPHTAPVRLSVYDAAGRELRRLAEGTRAAGSHTVAWDLRDGSGRSVAPGLYFVRFEAGGRTLTRRLAVAR